MDELDGEAEKKGIEEDFKKSRVTVFEEGEVGSHEREKEAERDGHDDVKSNFTSGAAVAGGEIDEGLEIHGDVGVVEDEGEGGEDGHESEKEDEREVDIQERVDEKGVVPSRAPFFEEYEKVEGGEGGKINDVSETH